MLNCEFVVMVMVMVIFILVLRCPRAVLKKLYFFENLEYFFASQAKPDGF